MQFEHTENVRESYRLPWRDRLPGPLGRAARFPWWTIAAALVVAYLLAQQFQTPSSRIIKAAAGLVLIALALRAKPIGALCFIAVMFPFPFSVAIGSSTMLFIVFMVVVYIARLTLGQVPGFARTPVDLGIGVLLAAYILSFYNVDNPFSLRAGVMNMSGILASFILYFLTAASIRTVAHLKTFSKFMGITAALAIFVCMWELVLPGRTLIPQWILFSGSSTLEEGYRVKGPFNDFELMSEYMAVSFFMAFFLYRRAESPNTRFFAGLLSVMCIFTLLATVTRGGFLAFVGGVGYLFWCLRRSLKFRDFVSILLVGVTLFLVLEFVVATFTRSGSVIERMTGTTFVGVVPDSRAGWDKIWDRAMEHPLVGHGPHYDLGFSRGFTGKGLYMYSWPHNQYLFYVHTVGLVGLTAILFIIFRLGWASFKTKGRSLQDESYAKSLMVVLHVMLLVMWVDQTKIDYLRNPIYQYFPWMLMGFLAATHRIIKEEEKAALPAATEP